MLNPKATLVSGSIADSVPLGLVEDKFFFSVEGQKGDLSFIYSLGPRADLPKLGSRSISAHQCSPSYWGLACLGSLSDTPKSSGWSQVLPERRQRVCCRWSLPTPVPPATSPPGLWRVKRQSSLFCAAQENLPFETNGQVLRDTPKRRLKVSRGQESALGLTSVFPEGNVTF